MGTDMIKIFFKKGGAEEEKLRVMGKGQKEELQKDGDAKYSFKYLTGI